MKKSHFITVVLILLSFLFNNWISAQVTVDEIITKHLEASGYGSISELTKFKIDGYMFQGKLKFPLTINGIIPDKLRMDMIYKEKDYVKISSGTVSWDYNPVSDSIKTTSNQKTEAQSFIERITGELYNYKTGSIKVNFVGEVSIDDVELYKLEVLVDKSIMIYYIDKLTYLIRRIDDDVMENKVTYYSNYKKVGKYMLPFSLIGFEGGISTISMQFKSFIINPEVNDDLFQKPLLQR